MQWCTAGLIASLAALIAGIAYRSLPVLIYAIATGILSGLIAWFGSATRLVPSRVARRTAPATLRPPDQEALRRPLP